MGFWKKLGEATGADVLQDAGRDTLVLMAQRFLRNIGYGCTLLIFVLFLTGLGYSETATGVFMTLTIMGDLLISIGLTVVADKVGRRRTLAIGAASVIGSGVVFALCSNYFVLLLGSVIGVITPTGNEMGPFKAIEESTICQLVSLDKRPQVLAWYYLLGTVGFAAGTLVSGLVVESLQSHGWTVIASYRAVFWLYTLLGVAKFVCCLVLTDACELSALERERLAKKNVDDAAARLLASSSDPVLEEAKLPRLRRALSTKIRSFFPAFEGESKPFIVKFAVIFLVDQVANGSLPFSFLVYYWKDRFQLSDDQNGAIFFLLGLVAASSNLAAGILTRKFGAVPTMIAVHFPCSVAAMLLPIPKSIYIALLLLLVRWSTMDMNQVPRQAFIASALRPEERTIAIGIFQVVRTAGTAVGPLYAGYLTEKKLFWVVLELYGCLRITYELLVWFHFWGYVTREERESEYALVATSPGGVEDRDADDDDDDDDNEKWENVHHGAGHAGVGKDADIDLREVK